MRVAVACMLLAGAASGQSFDVKKPHPKARGKLYRHKSSDGIDYLYRIPKDYRAKDGAPLLFLMRGPDRHFRHNIVTYPGERFRDDAIFLSPGISELVNLDSRRGSIVFAPKVELARALHSLHREFKRLLTIRRTILLGTGTGASFALFYAGEYPADVQGVLAEAGPLWVETKVRKEQEHQAIMLLKQAGDPHCAFSDVFAAFGRYRKIGLKHLRLSIVNPHYKRKLDRWQKYGCSPDVVGCRIAWCEAMSSVDSKAIAAAYERAIRIRDKRYHDFASLYQLAKKARKERTVVAIERLAERHAQVIRRSARGNTTRKLERKGWVAHFVTFRSGFRGIPACEALAREWRPQVKRHEAIANNGLNNYRALREKDPKAAFAVAASIMQEACLSQVLFTHPLVTELEQWHKEAGPLRLNRRDVQIYDDYSFARSKGLTVYWKLNTKFKP